MTPTIIIAAAAFIALIALLPFVAFRVMCAAVEAARAEGAKVVEFERPAAIQLHVAHAA
jgi:hypothetical protein